MRGVIARLPIDADTGKRKGFGFIKSAEQDYFFHASGLQMTTLLFDQLVEGQMVEFTPLADSPKGPRAIEVRVVETEVSHAGE